MRQRQTDEKTNRQIEKLLKTHKTKVIIDGQTKKDRQTKLTDKRQTGKRIDTDRQTNR